MAHSNTSSHNVFVFDTETTGLLKDRPYLVSIAYQVYAVYPATTNASTNASTENTENTNATVMLLHKAYYIIKPPNDTYEIPPESTKVHKITTEHARTHGITYSHFINQLKKVFTTYNIQTIVAHNIRFDMGVLSLNLRRMRKVNGLVDELLETIGNIDIFCTQEGGTSVTKLEMKYKRPKTTLFPSSATKKYKFPKLCELYTHYFGGAVFNAHCADSDTSACARCYFKMVYGLDIESQ